MTEPEKSTKQWDKFTGRIDQTMFEKYAADKQTSVYCISGLSEMVSAMKKLLADEHIGVDSIHTEEFASFTLDHNNEVRTDELFLFYYVLRGPRCTKHVVYEISLVNRYI